MVLGKTSKSYSDNFAKNRVCVQSKADGQEVKKGTSVDITLSLGPEPTYSYLSAYNIRIDSPFDYETEPAAVIKFVLSQDGKQIVLSELGGTKSDSDFPMQIAAGEIKGVSASEGQLFVYKDSKQVDSYSVTFKKVAD